MNRFLKKAVAAVLAVTMAFGGTVSAFADGGKEINYVSIGDSMANGYGFVDYYQDKKDRNLYDFLTGEGMYGKGAYPLQFEAYLESQGYDVNHTKLAASAMMPSDFLYLLGGRDYFDNGWSGYKDYIGTYTDEELKPHIQKAIREADVITMGLGNASFGAFLLDRVTSALGVFGASLDEDEKLTLNDALDRLNESQRKEILKIYDKLTVKLLDAIPAEYKEQYNVEDICELISYTAADFIVGYEGVMSKIIEMNPDVEIIIVGLMNTTYGMNITGENGEILLEVGNILDEVFGVLNAYMAGLPATMQMARQWNDAEFYFAEQPEPKFICQVFEDLLNKGWEPIDSDRLDGATVRSRNIDAFNSSLKDMIDSAFDGWLGMAGYDVTLEDVQTFENKDIYEPLMAANALNNGDYSVVEYLKQGEWFNGSSMTEKFNNEIMGRLPSGFTDRIPGIAIYLGIERAVAKSTNTMDIPLEGLMNIADLNKLMGVFSDFDVDVTDEQYQKDPALIADALADYLTSGDVLPAMCKIYGLFKVGNGMSVHPTPSGHDEIAASVIAAYGNHTVKDETKENLKEYGPFLLEMLKEYGPEIMGAVFQYAKENGYIDMALKGLADFTIEQIKTLAEIFSSSSKNPSNHVCEKAEGVVEQEATCTEAGLMVYYCECDKVVDVKVIPMLDHDFDDNGICNECGFYSADEDVCEYYSVKVDVGEGGKVVASGTGNVREGSDRRYVIIADEGYEIESVMLDKTEITEAAGEKEYVLKLKDIDEDYKIKVTFVKASEVVKVENSASAEKANPSTGSSDMVGAAVALAVVSVMGAAVLSKKR